MIVVTGATGNIGSEVVKQAAAVGARLRALVRDPKKATALKGRNVELFEGDLAKPDTLDAAFFGAEKVFLLSSLGPAQVQLQGNAVEAAKRARVRHVVKLSTAGASGDSPVSFFRWHAQTEQQIERAGIAWTFLRPRYFMQNLLAYAPSIVESGTFFAPARDARIAPVDVRDVAAVAVDVLTGTGFESMVCEISGPEVLSFADMASKLSVAAGRKVTYRDIAPVEARDGMRVAGAPDWLVDGILAIFARFVAAQTEAVSPAVEDLTGYPPRGFDEFARDHAARFRGK